MRKLIVTEFVSLDGVMEGPGSDDPYQQAGWTMPFGSEEFMKFKLDELMAADALLLGRITYDGFAKAWPTMTGSGEFGERMNSIAKYVVTSSLDQAAWNNSHVLKGDVASAVTELKQQTGLDILVAGSSRLVQALMQHNLVDEYRLLVYPVILGSGKKLFQEGVKADLKLTEARKLGEQVVLLRYVPGQG